MSNDYDDDNLTSLVLIMIDSHTEYGDELGFTKTDIDKIIRKYEFYKHVSCNELGWIILWENGYITDELFANKMDVAVIDKHIYLIADSFDDILGKDYETEISILDWDDDWWTPSYCDYDAEVSYNWQHYDENTLKSIMEYCFKNGLEIDDEEMTEENTILKDGKLYFNDKELNDLIYEDSLEELKDILNTAICEADDSANRDATYDAVKKAFENSIGTIERKMVKGIEYKTKKEIDVEKIYIKLDLNMKDIKHFLRDCYGQLEYIDSSYGNLVQVLKEMEFFDFKKPYYDYISGDIDKDELNQTTRDRLSWG